MLLMVELKSAWIKAPSPIDVTDGIPMNPQEACRCYKLAADQGDPDGIHNYRLMIRLI